MTTRGRENKNTQTRYLLFFFSLSFFFFVAYGMGDLKGEKEKNRNDDGRLPLPLGIIFTERIGCVYRHSKKNRESDPSFLIKKAVGRETATIGPFILGTKEKKSDARRFFFPLRRLARPGWKGGGGGRNRRACLFFFDCMMV